MKKTSFIKYTVGLASIAMIFTVFTSSAFAAQSTTGSSAALTRIITRGDSAITARINSMNALVTKVQAMKNLNSSQQTSLTQTLQTNISNLTTLKSKLDADTDTTTARADAKSITDAYRIYALVNPQVNLLAASDRVTTITTMMTTLGTQLQAKIATAQSAGKNVTALQAALADMTTQVSNAETQAQSVVSGISTLAPDQGNTTVAASNKAALTAARTAIKTATANLKTARQDIKTITRGLR